MIQDKRKYTGLMKIISLEYWNKTEGWGFDEIRFFDLTLLVGASGVGKTQILKAIMDIKQIALDGGVNSAKWKIKFKTRNAEYLWRGEITNKTSNETSEFIYEELICNNRLLFEREKDRIVFKGSKMPKLSPDESLISIFNQETQIIEVEEGFRNIFLKDNTKYKEIFTYEIILNTMLDVLKTLEDIRGSGWDIIWKLVCLYSNQRDEFQKIVDDFSEVFPMVVDVKVTTIVRREDDDFVHFPIISIKEKYVENWIPQARISSGMLRTFLHLSELYLLRDGSVILVDEFENSLGVNCIDVLTEDLVFEHSRLQFIATSHHPYIINKIPYDHWKIVTRKGGKIKTLDAKEFNLGESHHDRFLNLVNLPQYKTGIETIES